MSIDIYALQRPFLVRRRKMILEHLIIQMGRVKREMERFNQEGTQTQKDIFDKEFQNLLNFAHNKAEYAGMCRFFIKKFLAENNLTP